MSQGAAPVEQHNDSVNQSDNEGKKDFVSLDTHRKLLDEKKKIQAKLDELAQKDREREELEAKKRGDYEAILKAREEELAKKNAEIDSIKTMIESAKKTNAIIDALGGNIDSKWHKLLDVSDIAINPDTGEVDQGTVARVAEAFKKEFPEAIRKPGMLPSQAPAGTNGGSGRITETEWKSLKTLKEMSKWRRDQIIWGQ